MVLRKLEKQHEVTRNGIIIPENAIKGYNMCKAKVESVGKEASLEGLEVGMIVLYDHFAGHFLTHPIVCTAIENVICVIDEE